MTQHDEKIASHSEEFEQMIARIHELLEGQDAEVKWNERIPDPDNPKQLRQVDVAVRNGSLFNLIECRMHKEKQDVKWIEELIGRRESLNANSVIAVSSSGFTSGALRKAARYGVTVNDLFSLSDEEIKSWARSIQISLFFYHYEEFDICLYFDAADIADIDPNSIGGDLQDFHGLRAVFQAPLGVIDGESLIINENRNKKVNFTVRFTIDAFYLQTKQVREIEIRGKVALERIPLDIPVTLAYGIPELSVEERCVHIQNFDLGKTSVVHHDGSVSLCLDLASLKTPPYWQFRFFEVSGEYEHYMDKLEIIDPEKLLMKVDKFFVSIHAADSR